MELLIGSLGERNTPNDGKSTLHQNATKSWAFLSITPGCQVRILKMDLETYKHKLFRGALLSRTIFE
jgi:hypothetical protein